MNAITEKRGTVSVTLQPLNEQTAVALANNIYVKDGTKSVQDVLDNIPNVDHDLLYANNVLEDRLYNSNIYDALKSQNGNKTLYTYDQYVKTLFGTLFGGSSDYYKDTKISNIQIITNNIYYKYYEGIQTPTINSDSKDTILFRNVCSPDNRTIDITNIPRAIIRDCTAIAEYGDIQISGRIFENITINCKSYDSNQHISLAGIALTNSQITVNNAYNLYCEFMLIGSTANYIQGVTDLCNCTDLHNLTLNYYTHSTQLSIYPQIMLACSFKQTDFSGSKLTCSITDMFDKFYELFIDPNAGPETIIVNAVSQISSVVVIYIDSRETKTLTLTNFDFANVSTASLNIPAVTKFPKLTNIHCNINLTASTVMTDFTLLSELGSNAQSVVTLQLSNACKTYITETQLTELTQKGWTVTFN